MTDELLTDARRLEVAKKHRAIRQSLLDELGSISPDELQRLRDARYGLKELVDDAGSAWAIYEQWYGAHWSGKGVGRPKEGVGFEMLLPDWRQDRTQDSRTMAEMYAEPEAWTRPPLKQGRGPMLEAVTDEAIRLQAHKNAKARNFDSDDERVSWIGDEIVRLNKRKRENAGDTKTLPTETLGTLFLYWAFEATAQFYQRFLPNRDSHFKAHRERRDKDCNTVSSFDQFSEAARFAFKLANGFEPGYAYKHCHDIVDLWNHTGTNQKKIGRRANLQDRLLLANRLFNPMQGSPDNPEFELGGPYHSR